MATSVDTGAEYEHAAPFTPVPYVLSFTDLCYSIKKGPDGVLMSSCLPSRRINRVASTDNNTRALLSGISGEARQGELFAVMGASGSGKSTLVDALAGRIARDSLQGTVTLNGEPLEGRRLRAISAYVMQEDLLHPMLTVRETLLYAAELRLSRALSPARKKERVDALLDQLGLTGAADTVIGDEAHRGVSGGERRRVSIGKDIVHDPILLVAILVTGLILSTIFLRLDDTPKGVKERLGFFAMALTTMYYVCTDRLQVFIQERHIYMRETAHNAYRPISYVLANAVVSFPPLVIMSLVFAVTTFFPVGLAGGVASFAFFSLVVLSSLWAGTGLVIFLSAALPHVMLAYTVVAALIACFRLLSGFFINRDRIPSYCSATPSGDAE